MVAYKENELVSATALTKKFGQYVSQIKEGDLEKIGILKNNKLEAVIISTNEYEFLKRLEETFMEHAKGLGVEDSGTNDRPSTKEKSDKIDEVSRLMNELDVPAWYRMALRSSALDNLGNGNEK